MKKSLFLSLMAVIIALVSCDKKADYQSVIPASPAVAVKTNIGQILNKSELLKDVQISGLAKMAISNLPEEARTLYGNILNDPKACGIDIDQPAFAIVENVKPVKGFALLAVKDEAQLKKLIDVTIQQFGGYSKPTLESAGGINEIKDQRGNTIMAFDAVKFVIPFAQGTTDAKEYMTPATDNGEKNSTFEAFIKKGSDIATYLDYNHIMDFAATLSPEMQGTNLDIYKNVKLATYLNFENGKIVLDYKVSGYDQAEEIYEKTTTAPDGKLFQYLPFDTWGVLQSGIKNTCAFQEYMPQETVAQFEELLNNINKELDSEKCDAKITLSLLSSIKGDLIAAIAAPANETQSEEPQGIVIAECADDKLFSTLKKIIQCKMGDAFQETAPNILKGYGYCFGYADNKTFLMPENIFNQCYSNGKFKKLDKNLTNAKLYSTMKQNIGLAVDFGKIAQFMKSAGDNKLAMAANIVSKFSEATIITRSATETEMQIIMSNGTTNALKQLKDMIFEISMLSMAI